MGVTDMCTREEFTAFVATMKCIYTVPSFLPDRESIEVWYMVLRHFPYADLKRSFATYYPVNTFPPTPADLIKHLVRPANKTGISAWREVMRAVRKYGPMEGRLASESVDSFTRDIVDSIGGWSSIRNCPTENLGFLMRQFVSAYDDCVQRETINLLPDTLKQTMIDGDGYMMLEGEQI